MIVLGLGVIGILGVMLYANSLNSYAPQGQASTQQLHVASAAANTGVQDVYVKALPSIQYDNPNPVVKANEPVRFHFTAEPGTGCGAALIMKDFGVNLVSQNGQEQVAQFTPPPGTYQFNCPMGMFRGTLVAK